MAENISIFNAKKTIRANNSLSRIKSNSQSGIKTSNFQKFIPDVSGAVITDVVCRFCSLLRESGSPILFRLASFYS